jgi:hypothetical protein
LKIARKPQVATAACRPKKRASLRDTMHGFIIEHLLMINVSQRL